MSTLTQEQLEHIVTKAALDPAFRKELKSVPREAVKKLIELDDDDLTRLAVLVADLERIGQAHLETIDAQSWARGICILRK